MKSRSSAPLLSATGVRGAAALQLSQATTLMVEHEYCMSAVWSMMCVVISTVTRQTGLKLYVNSYSPSLAH